MRRFLILCAVLTCGTAAAADITVGPARAYRTLAAGVAAAEAGDRILLEPGVYTDDTVTTTVALTIEGLGGGAVLRASKPLANRKGLVVSNATLTVRNLTFDGAYVTAEDGNNGAGIRGQAGDLTVENCIFSDNQDGILVDAIAGATVRIAGSTFSGNGAGDGYSHGIYVNEVAKVTVTTSIFTGTKVGHDIKSRALVTAISQTVLDDGVTGTTSYAVDLRNGGLAVLDEVRITQGPRSQNPAMVAYGAEGNLKAANGLIVSNSTFRNQLASASAVAISNFTRVPATLRNNQFQDIRALRGPGGVPAMP